MKNNPVITIFIVTYNQENNIERTIKSVVAQKISYPYIIHILDDCSTDNTSNICREYEKQYPDIIKVSVEPRNTKCWHAKKQISNIKTKYWALIEGDDYWCDEHRVERSLDFLEKNEKYVGYATDYLIKKKDESFSGVASTGRNLNSLNGEIHMSTMIYIHTAARVLRNIVDFKHLIHHKCFGDTFQLVVYLDKGPIYFENKVTSVYNLSDSGIWTRLPEEEKLYRNEELWYELNKLLKFRHDGVFSVSIRYKQLLVILKKLFGKKVGWCMYMLFSYVLFKYHQIGKRKNDIL